MIGDVHFKKKHFLSIVLFSLFFIISSLNRNESPFAATLPHGQLLPESWLLRRRYGILLDCWLRLLLFQHVEQVGFDAGLMGVQLHVVPALCRVRRFLPVDESLLEIAHHLLTNRLLHGQVLFDVLPVIRLLLVVAARVIALVVLGVRRPAALTEAFEKCAKM